MEYNTTKKISVPVRSAMSDEELSSLLKRAKAEHPDDFESRSYGEESGIPHFNHIPSVTEIISKWL